MPRPSSHSARFALVVFTLASVTACETRHTEPPARASAGGDVADTASGGARPRTMMGVDTAHGADTARTPHAGALTAPHIFGMFDDASATEITAAGIAVEKARSQAVKNFATQMIRDHRALLHESRTLAARLGVAPQTTSDSALIKLELQMLDTLRTAPSGSSFDSLFIATQIRMHQRAIDAVRAAAQAAPDSQTRDFLQNALNMLQTHLRDAERIQKGLPA